MKKKYQEPLMKVVALKRRTHLLAGSGYSTTTTMGFGGDATEEEEGD